MHPGRPPWCTPQAISDPVLGTDPVTLNVERVTSVLGALKCAYYLAKTSDPQTAPFWACNTYNLCGNTYASTVVPPPRVGYIRAALNGDTTWYISSVISTYGEWACRLPFPAMCPMVTPRELQPAQRSPNTAARLPPTCARRPVPADQEQVNRYARVVRPGLPAL